MTKTVGKISQMTSSIEWEVEKFSSLSSKAGDQYVSSDFQCYNATWYLKLFPNGHGVYTGYISLFLYLKKSSNPKQFVNYKLSLKKKDGTYYTANETYDFTEGTGRGSAVFATRSKLLTELDTQDVLKIFCTIDYERFIPDESSQEKALQFECSTSNPISLERITRSLKDLFLNEIDTDIIIKVQEHRIPAHKLILAARSSVFVDILQKGTEENGKRILEITDFQPENVKDFLLYVYCGCEDIITLGNAFELYALSDKFYVEDLKSECVEFLKLNLSAKNICDVLLFAENHNEPLLKQAAKRVLADNASDILSSDAWKKFRNENTFITLDTLQSIVLDKCLKTPDEEKSN